MTIATEEYDALDAAIDGAMDMVATLRGGVVALDEEGEPQFVPNPVLTHDTRTRAVQWTPADDLPPMPTPAYDGPMPPPETRALGLTLIVMFSTLIGVGIGAWLF